MNNLKNKAGFTLVELIVVIAILAILAGVAVPAYSGYITKAKEAGDTTVLSSILTAAQASNATAGAVTDIEVVCDATDGKVTSVKINNGTAMTFDATDKWGTNDFNMYMNSVQPVLKGSYKTAGGATWSSAGWVAGVTPAGGGN